jgi:transposase
VALVDALGNLVRFVLVPGQRHDSVAVAPLLGQTEIAALIADKAFDNDGLRAALDERGTVAVIPPKSDRIRRIACALPISSPDRELLLQAEGLPTDCDALRQNRHELRGDDPSGRFRPGSQMNVNRP